MRVRAMAAADRGSAAARLFGQAEMLAEQVDAVLQAAEQRLRNETEAGLRAALGDTAFESERAAGRRLTAEEALTIARDLV